jgi:transcriptional regulator with XRE-family HTH domain
MAGDGLKAIRDNAGMTQQQLADQLGVHYMSIANWEAGRNRPSLKHVQRLEELFGLDGQLLTEFAYAGVTPFDQLRAEVEALAEQGARLTELVVRLQHELTRQGEEIDGLRKR